MRDVVSVKRTRGRRIKTVLFCHWTSCFFGPGEYLTSDLFELDKKDYITVTDRLSGLILSERLKGKSTKETIRTLKGFMFKLCVPVTLRSNCGTNYKSKEFEDFCKEYGINHVQSSPYFHQGNGASEKSVDVLKRMIMKNKTKSIEELCYNLNYLVRKGQTASPMEMFFGRNV